MSKPGTKFSTKENERARAETSIEILDETYHEVVRTRTVRRAFKALVREHDAISKEYAELEQDPRAVIERDEARAKEDDLEEAIERKRCEIVSLLVARRAEGEDVHPPVDAMVEDMDGRDIGDLFMQLLGIEQEAEGPTKPGTSD